MDTELEEFADKAVQYSLDKGAQYCDVRAEIISKNGFSIENGQIEHFGNKNELGIGIRILAKGAWGFFSVSNPKSLESIKNGVTESLKSAIHFSEKKKEKINFSVKPPFRDKIDFPVKIEPTIDELIKIGFECDKIIQKNKRIIKSQVSIGKNTISKYFTNSENSKITQNFTDTIADLTATAYESGLTESINITEGGKGGIEKIINPKNITETAEFISKSIRVN